MSESEHLRSEYREADEIDLRDFLRVIWVRKALIIAVTLFFTAAFTVAAFLATPTYKVETLLAPTIDDPSGSSSAALAGQLGSIASLAGFELGGAGGAREEAIALLQSQSLTSQFILDHQLLPQLFDDRWDSDSKQWKGDDPGDVPTIWMALKKFNRIRLLSENQKTGLVTLSIEWSDPEVAAAWASALVDQVNEAMRKLAIDEAQRSMEFLEKALRETDVVEVRQAIYALMEGQTKSLMMANVRREYAFKVLDPAIVPDANDPTSPRKALLTGLGFVLGLMIGTIMALALGRARNT